MEGGIFLAHKWRPAKFGRLLYGKIGCAFQYFIHVACGAAEEVGEALPVWLAGGIPRKSALPVVEYGGGRFRRPSCRSGRNKERPSLRQTRHFPGGVTPFANTRRCIV